MQRSILLLLLFYLCFESNAQSISGIVLDKETNEPLPYASVYLSSLKRGNYTAESGQFSLRYDSPDDTIIISVIGYTSFMTEIKNLKSSENIIYLEPNMISLDEVVVTPPKKKKKTFMLGATNRDKMSVSSPMTTDSGGFFSVSIEHFLFIDGKDAPMRIKKIIVGCSKKENWESVFRIRLYTMNKNTKEPDELVNNKDIIKGFTHTKSKKITFDIENESIILPPEGLFVSVEHIRYNYNEQVDYSSSNKYIFSETIGGRRELSITYVKSKKGAIAGIKKQGLYYIPFEGHETYFQMEKQKRNVMIRLEVEEL